MNSIPTLFSTSSVFAFKQSSFIRLCIKTVEFVLYMASNTEIGKLVVKVPVEITSPKACSSPASQLKREKNRIFVKAAPAAPTFANLSVCEGCRLNVGGLLNSPRHHCRNCGGSFCETCSTKSIDIPYPEYRSKGKLRVCDTCFEKIADFVNQVGSTVTWSGLQPASDRKLKSIFEFRADEVYSF